MHTMSDEHVHHETHRLLQIILEDGLRRRAGEMLRTAIVMAELGLYNWTGCVEARLSYLHPPVRSPCRLGPFFPV